jgi:hydrogenase maturation factor
MTDSTRSDPIADPMTDPLTGALVDSSGDLWTELAVASLAIARRFAASATMWCAAPQWPVHGRHVAVEFVHPVIVGKRALPAVSVESTDLVGAVRLLARPGDVLLAIGTADDPRVGRLLQRADAWGVTGVWIGAGSRPPVGAADHVVWLDDRDAARFARAGELVLLYHLLWELTHVVFEHPGLLAGAPASGDAPCTDDGCVTCSDEGRVAEVAVVVDAGQAEALVAGHLETIDVSLIEPVAPGDLVLVHAGVAITSLSEAGREGASERTLDE